MGIDYWAGNKSPWLYRLTAASSRRGRLDLSNFTKTEAGRETALGMQALKRLAQPDEITPVEAFLASEDAR